MIFSVLVPTIRGRDDAHGQVVAEWEAQASGYRHAVEIVQPRDYPTVGDAWNAGAAASRGDVLVFAIDDALPHAGCLEAAVAAVSRGVIPSPRLVFPDGTLEACGTMGAGALMPECATGTPCRAAGLLAVSRPVWNSVGSFLPIHYYSDDEWCWRALNRAGRRCEVVRDFAFMHGHHQVRRAQMQERAAADRAAFLAAVAAYPPGVVPGPGVRAPGEHEAVEA